MNGYHTTTMNEERRREREREKRENEMRERKSKKRKERNIFQNVSNQTCLP